MEEIGLLWHVESWNWKVWRIVLVLQRLAWEREVFMGKLLFGIDACDLIKKIHSGGGYWRRRGGHRSSVVSGGNFVLF
jgi:hypothetical protein